MVIRGKHHERVEPDEGRDPSMGREVAYIVKARERFER